MYRLRNGAPQVLLVHPGGPFWARKDAGAWSIPKGEYQEGEDPLSAAQREFMEETGFSLTGPFLPLAPVTQRGGKVISAWAVEGDCDPAVLRSNVFAIEWPPKSGKTSNFPEVDRAEWFSLSEAREKMLAGQLPLLTELLERIGGA